MATYGQPMYGAQGGMKQPLYQSATGGYAYSDLESGQQALFPGITVSDQTLRWGFIRKARFNITQECVCGELVLLLTNSSLPSPTLSLPTLTAVTRLHPQVYGILCAQMVLTAITCATVRENNLPAAKKTSLLGRNDPAISSISLFLFAAVPNWLIHITAACSVTAPDSLRCASGLPPLSRWWKR